MAKRLDEDRNEETLRNGQGNETGLHWCEEQTGAGRNGNVRKRIVGANYRTELETGRNWGVHEEQYWQRGFDPLQERPESKTGCKYSDEQGIGAH